ncbi:Hypothetical protein NTJ_04955 [Nesidiocoris tenuis]|uniref:Uncharacterized protein n=1 Tax=Nesidiocoris tenuis TaxID=355587 RepID=A0ABN7ALF6_9HEMI|nr:Hypothetical protein NTJ_04955 [Nesidiocoris tenuis]
MRFFSSKTATLQHHVTADGLALFLGLGSECVRQLCLMPGGSTPAPAPAPILQRLLPRVLLRACASELPDPTFLQ